MARLIRCAVICLAMGCGPPPDSNPDAGERPFIAFASSFNGYRSWRSTPATAPAGAPQPPEALHGAHLVAFINQAPQHGSTEFPIGTIIVKEPDPDGGAVDGGLTFAMAKRGGNFDSAGAVNWEWF